MLKINIKSEIKPQKDKTAINPFYINIKLYCSLLISVFLTQSCGKDLTKLESLFQLNSSKSNNTESPTPSGISTAPSPTSSSGSISLFYENIVAPISYSGSNPSFNKPYNVSSDQYGNVYVCDTSNQLIRKITPTGEVSTIAGTGGFGNTDGLSTIATFTNTKALAVDSIGNIYVVGNFQYNNIRKITPAGVVSTFAGSPTAFVSGFADGNGTAATFNNPSAITIDSTNVLYVTDTGNGTIRRIDTNGDVLTIAGDPAFPSSYADGVGSAAQFDYPVGITMNPAGNLFVTDQNNHVIRKITLNPVTHIGTVTTVAGTQGFFGYGSSNGTLLGGATFGGMTGIASDASGILYVCDTGNQLIRKVDIIGDSVTTLAGMDGVSGYDDGNGLSASFNTPTGITIGPDGNLYIADKENSTIRKITPTGDVSTYSGIAEKPGSSDNTGPRSLPTTFANPAGIAIDSAGNMYISERYNQTVRIITSAGEVTTYTGTNIVPGSTDGNIANALFYNPFGLTVDSSRNIYLTDTSNETIRKIDYATGNVSTIAGTLLATGSTDAIGTAASFNDPSDVAIDSIGNLYISDTFNNTIRKMDLASGNVTTFAGSLGGVAGHADGLGTAATFFRPKGLAIDSLNNLYVADENNSIIRKITPAGQVTTVAGQALVIGAINGPAANATFKYPTDVAVDTAGNLYVADYINVLVRKIDTGGNVTTLAGSVGVQGSTDGTGTAALFNAPYSIAVGPDGNIYLVDSGNMNIRRITPAGIVTTIAGTAGNMGSNNSNYGAAQFLQQGGITQGPDGSVYIADTFNHLIRKIGPSGNMIVLAGSGSEGQANENGNLASFRYPQGITLNSSGNLYVADTFNHTIRQITPAGNVTTFAGTPGLNGNTTLSLFNYPQGITIDSSDNLYVADTLNAAIRKITPAGVVSTLTQQRVQGYADGPMASALFSYIKNVVLDYNGNMFVADTGNNVIRKLTNFLGIGANVETLIGLITGQNSSVNRSYSTTAGVAIGTDISGNIYSVDYTNSVIKKTAINGTITTIAGKSGTAAYMTGALPGTLLHPTSMYVDPAGNYLYVLENNSIVKITLTAN